MLIVLDGKKTVLLTQSLTLSCITQSAEIPQANCNDDKNTPGHILVFMASPHEYTSGNT